MAQITGLFQRGSAYYLRIVLPSDHPLQNVYRNGRYVVSLGTIKRREAVAKATVRRAEVLGGFQLATLSSSLDAKTVGTSLLRAYELWAKARPRTNDTKSACLRAVTLAHTFTEQTVVEKLTRRQGSEFMAWLQHPDRKTSSKTARDRMNWVKTLLKFVHRDLELIPKNPWEGLEIVFKTTNKRRPWTDAELVTLFHQPLHLKFQLPHDTKAGKEAAYWIPLLGLYTGARVGELAQLRVDDVDLTGSVPFIRITDEGDLQRVKTLAGIRTVPIHSQLLALGFSDYVKACSERGDVELWQHLPRREERPGGYFSHWFGQYRKSLGLGTKPDFHCLRHTVRSSLANNGVPSQLIDAILGHEAGGSVGEQVYTHWTIEAKSNALEALSYPALTSCKISDGPFTSSVCQSPYS